MAVQGKSLLSLISVKKGRAEDAREGPAIRFRSLAWRRTGPRVRVWGGRRRCRRGVGRAECAFCDWGPASRRPA